MPMGDWGWWHQESFLSPYSSSGKYPPNSPVSIISLIDGAKKRCQPFFFSTGLLQPCTSSHLFEVDVAVWCRNQFLYFFIFFLLCSAHLGLLVFGTMMKRDRDKTWLPSIWRHCLCHGAFLPSVLSAWRKSGCVKFAVPTLQNWQKSILLETSGPRALSSHRLFFPCYVFLTWMKESYWCGSYWPFSHSGGY